MTPSEHLMVAEYHLQEAWNHLTQKHLRDSRMPTAKVQIFTRLANITDYVKLIALRIDKNWRNE